MTRDLEVLRAWLLAVVVIAAIGATAVPILYSFLPWRKSRIGSAFMLKAISFAAAMDMTVLFAFWQPEDILVMFWVEALVFTAIAISTTRLVWVTFRLRYPEKRRGKLLFNAGVYDFLKKLVTIILPALSVLYYTIAQFWGLPNPEAVMGTIGALTTFLGVCIGISTKTYNTTELKYDGNVVLEPGDEGSKLRLQNISQKALETKDEILLRIDR
jgi:hypothetical protein